MIARGGHLVTEVQEEYKRSAAASLSPQGTVFVEASILNSAHRERQDASGVPNACGGERECACLHEARAVEDDVAEGGHGWWRAEEERTLEKAHD